METFSESKEVSPSKGVVSVMEGRTPEKGILEIGPVFITRAGEAV